MKKNLLIVVLLAFYSASFGQNPLVAVDGFFVNIKKSEVLKYIGKDNIKDTITISLDSSKVLLGKYGDNGLFIINTKNPRGKESSSLYAKNLRFDAKPTIFVDGIPKKNEVVNTIDPQSIESIQVLSPLEALKERGIDYIGGIINIYLKK